ncbi:hypothetical protein [Roseateles sp. P5_E1]
MDRFVFKSASKVFAFLSPLIVLAVALTVLVSQSADFLLFAVSVDALALAALARQFPLNKPILELTTTEIRYGQGLRDAILLRDVKYASAPGASSHDWPGVVNINLNMEARKAGGQLHYDMKVIKLFCPDVAPKELEARINQLVEAAKRNL